MCCVSYCHREYRFFFASLNELTVFPYDVIQSCLSVSLLGGGVVFAYLQQSEGEMCIFFSWLVNNLVRGGSTLRCPFWSECGRHCEASAAASYDTSLWTHSLADTLIFSFISFTYIFFFWCETFWAWVYPPDLFNTSWQLGETTVSDPQIWSCGRTSTMLANCQGLFYMCLASGKMSFLSKILKVCGCLNP